MTIEEYISNFSNQFYETEASEFHAVLSCV